MIGPLVLLLGVEAPVLPASVSIAVDPCVQVDEGEVRRLAALELRTWAGEPSTMLRVEVGCAGEREEIRVTDLGSGRVELRSIDLSGLGETPGDAKARELALAIAELLRRVEAEPTPPAPPPPPPPPKREPPRRVAPVRPVRAALGAEVGVSGVAAGWTGGEVLMGADFTSRVRFRGWLVGELRLGGRKTRPIELTRGSVDGRGVAGAIGLAVAPFDTRSVGVSFGVRLAEDWLRYDVMDQNELRYGSAEVGAISVAGTTTVFVTLVEPLRVTVDVAAGGALHAVAVREGGRRASGISGLLVSGAAGLALEL